jgi:hypothetical protein
MRGRALLGWLWVFAILLAGGVQAGEPGSDESPSVEQRTVVAPPPAPAPEPEPESPVPMVNDEQPVSGGKCTVTCYRPVWKTRDVNCTRRVCKYRDETRTCKVPVYTQEQRSRTVICWKTECVTEMHTMTSCQNVVDECGRCCPQVVTCEVPVQVPKRVPYEVEQPYTVCVCNWEEREYNVQIPYWDTEEFTCTQQYCEMEPYEVEVCPQPCCVPCCPAPCGPVGFMAAAPGCSTCN